MGDQGEDAQHPETITGKKATQSMGERRLLDCTLRDGGYINDWKFGRTRIRNIYAALARAGLDLAEVGFLDERAPLDPARSMFPDTDAVDRCLGDIDGGRTRMLAMIDYGTCGRDRIRPCQQTCLSGIRVIFRKQMRRAALDFCGELKALGYQVFAQLVSVTSYQPEEMEDLIRLANEARPDAIYVVDTYGLLHQGGLMQYIDCLDEGLQAGIGIGYHGHNNFQMGYANCISVLRRQTRRDIYVDASLCGMGKRAGNAPTELVAMHMCAEYGRRYDVIRLLEAAEASVLPFYRVPPWGYDLRYFLAAYSGCHPQYVEYCMESCGLSLRKTWRVLQGLPRDRRLTFDRVQAEAACRRLPDEKAEKEQAEEEKVLEERVLEEQAPEDRASEEIKRSGIEV